jgi:predicted nucleotidyltransferase
MTTKVAMSQAKLRRHDYGWDAMDLRHPLSTVTPTLDGDVLLVLAGVDAELTGREVHRLAIRGSEHGVRKVLDRLAGEGVVHRRPAGSANLYRLNREHLAAPAIEALAGLRQELLRRTRAAVAEWAIAASGVVLFGSFARGEAGRERDIDVLVVRRPAVDPDDPAWRTQLTGLEAALTAWTGNDARVLELGEEELAVDEDVVANALREGLEIAGSLRRLRSLHRGDR